jgi:thioredoxin 1
MSTIELNSENFEQITSGEGIVLVDAWAPWCAPCRGFAPVFESASERHPEHVFAKLDTQAEKEIRERLGIQHIPSLLVYRDGILLYNDAGSPPGEALDELIVQAEALDMDEVRERRQAREEPSD